MDAELEFSAEKLSSKNSESESSESEFVPRTLEVLCVVSLSEAAIAAASWSSSSASEIKKQKLYYICFLEISLYIKPSHGSYK